MTTHQNNSTFREIRLPKTWSIHHHEINQRGGLPTQISKFYKDPSNVSCFYVGTLPKPVLGIHNPAFMKLSKFASLALRPLKIAHVLCTLFENCKTS
jgi:hypothetical protein